MAGKARLDRKLDVIGADEKGERRRVDDTVCFQRGLPVSQREHSPRTNSP